jgi:hypothetical protein
MGKSRKTSVVKRLKKTANKTLPVVNNGLKSVGTAAKNVASASIPIIEKGVSAVYGTMSSGLDLGVKGVESISKKYSHSKSRSKSRSKSHSKSRSLAGGRKTKRRHARSRRHRN